MQTLLYSNKIDTVHVVFFYTISISSYKIIQDCTMYGTHLHLQMKKFCTYKLCPRINFVTV
jgi:hypothetical protein